MVRHFHFLLITFLKNFYTHFMLKILRQSYRINLIKIVSLKKHNFETVLKIFLLHWGTSITAYIMPMPLESKKCNQNDQDFNSWTKLFLAFTDSFASYLEYLNNMCLLVQITFYENKTKVYLIKRMIKMSSFLPQHYILLDIFSSALAVNTNKRYRIASEFIGVPLKKFMADWCIR